MKCFENYSEHTDGYVFIFDLKSVYHHVDVFEEHQTYLGVSQKINNVVKLFVFTVLPFGVSTAPFVFTKVVRPLVKYWRLNSIKIACFLDDGLGIGSGKIYICLKYIDYGRFFCSFREIGMETN